MIFQKLPMGLSNSAATFQRVMEACFSDKNVEILLIYLEDILIFSSTVEEQIERLTFVFEQLRKHGLKLKPSKCHFFQKRSEIFRSCNFRGRCQNQSGENPSYKRLEGS